MKSFEIYKLGEVVVISAITEEGASVGATESPEIDVDVPEPTGIALTGWNLEPSAPRLGR